ncbi:hypothetical protein RVIR1_05740 [Candidatus Rickettsiella viridis]|uniref:Uncharacterized protein n=1 Tax=Candidatus Rickettsiella viridis TaxID=676208 RepID=A0A2Z5UTX0_9COXI|nr:hypothetical protein [Candidatus Rickettsiella viridis]BBB15076.1 hypothetical protein RVIR1_05740 [Candidatus Rickettsiella viridis]
MLKCLKKNSTLTSIRFNTKIITNDTLIEIANALENNTTLFSIDDRFTDLSPQIKAAIHRNKKINELTNSALASLHTILYLNECPSVLAKIPKASLIINKKIHRDEELNQFIESISKIKASTVKR